MGEPRDADDGMARQIALRMDPELLRRVEKHRTRLRRAWRGVNLSRADTLRALLEDALARAEGGEA